MSHVELVQPPNVRQARIIERTAAFVAAQGAQMEIVIKARQRNTNKFDFLDWEHRCHQFYRHTLKAIKGGAYTPTVSADEPPKEKKYRKKRKRTTACQPTKDADRADGDCLYDNTSSYNCNYLRACVSVERHRGQRLTIA